MMTQPLSEHDAAARARSWDDDARVVRECLHGDELAWSQLLAKYKNLIFSIPIKYGFSQEEAADIFQSVCLDLVNQLGTLRETRALAGWLISITHNKCFHYMKDKKRHGVQEEDDQPDPAIPAAEMPENILVELQREQLLRTAVRALSVRCQRLVEMLFFEIPPRPYEEIAKAFTLATGSVGFIRGRCLDKLRKKLEEMGFA